MACLLAMICLATIFNTARAQVEVSFTEESYTYNENELGAEFCISVPEGIIQPGQAIAVGYRSVNVTATPSVDYNLPKGAVELNRRNQFATHCVSITIFDDSISEPLECFNVFIDVSPLFNVVEPNQTTVCIRDNDTPDRIGFSESAVTVNEGSSVDVCAKVMDNQQLIRNVIFNIETADGSALAGQDYSFLSVELTFNPVNYQQLQCISISTVDDSLIEGDELFFVDMKTKSSQVSIDPGRLTVNISAAGAQVEVSFTEESYTYNENELGAEFCISVPDGIIQPGLTIAVGYRSVNVTATPSVDYNLDEGAVELNRSNQFATHCVPVTIFDDSISEPLECFNVFIDDSPLFNVVEPNQAMICIRDDDTPDRIGFSESAVTVSEGSPVIVCAQVMDGQQLVRNVIFTIETTNSSALAGQDYSFLSVELTFNPVNDQQPQCMSINTVDDSVVEGDELFFVDMKAVSPRVSIDPSRLTVKIFDKNRASPCKPSPCDSDATCTASGGTAICACNSGFVGNGFACHACT